jgi:catechol 2,3-dioxygenase-like lactoylglutathione lyase family enzyme
MKQRIACISLLVKDYDEAISFFTKKLNFELIEDTILNEQKRWVIVSPPGSSECTILLAKASNDEQIKYVGNQTGGRVFLFLNTDNFQRDYQNLLNHGVTIVREPSVEIYGTVAVFEDLYGNLWDLIEPNNLK